MKKLVWLTLLCTALAPMATGCIIVDDDPDPGPGPDPDPDPDPPGPGVLDVTWTLTEGQDETPIAGCAEGMTAEVVSEDTVTKTQYLDTFDCVDAGGVTAAIPPGDYDVWVNVYNGTDVEAADLIAQSGFQTVTVYGDDTVVVDFSFPAGASFYLTWSITDEVGPDALCEDVVADGVSVLSTLVGTETAIDDIFDCDAYEATTPQMLLGEYVVSVSLLDGEENLNEFPVADPYTLEFGNQVVDLEHFEFVLTP